MPIFTDTDLADFGALAQDLAFKDTCNILRDSNAHDDGMGGETATSLTVVASNVPCLIIDIGLAKERILADQVTGRMPKQAMLPRLTDVRPNDRLQVGATASIGTTYVPRAFGGTLILTTGSGSPVGGVVYHVIMAMDPSTFEVVRRVMIAREEQEQV